MAMNKEAKLLCLLIAINPQKRFVFRVTNRMGVWARANRVLSNLSKSPDLLMFLNILSRLIIHDTDLSYAAIRPYHRLKQACFNPRLPGSLKQSPGNKSKNIIYLRIQKPNIQLTQDLSFRAVT
jgi:hypothetical protein